MQRGFQARWIELDILGDRSAADQGRQAPRRVCVGWVEAQSPAQMLCRGTELRTRLEDQGQVKVVPGVSLLRRDRFPEAPLRSCEVAGIDGRRS